jgi:hypothetical protein
VDIEILVRIVERTVEVTMLDPVAPAAVIVAAAAGLATGLANLLGDFRKVDALDDLARAGREFGVLGDRTAEEAGRFLVLAGLVMADQTIDIGFRGQVEMLVLGTVADVASGAETVIRCGRRAEIVDDVLLPSN